MIEKSTDSSVFHFTKCLDNNSVLSCSVVMMPLPKHHRSSYTFILELSRGGIDERETVEDVTCDRNTAEHIFDLLCSGNVYPCHLYDVICDLIV